MDLRRLRELAGLPATQEDQLITTTSDELVEPDRCDQTAWSIYSQQRLAERGLAEAIRPLEMRRIENEIEMALVKAGPTADIEAVTRQVLSRYGHEAAVTFDEWYGTDYSADETAFRDEGRESAFREIDAEIDQKMSGASIDRNPEAIVNQVLSQYDPTTANAYLDWFNKELNSKSTIEEDGCDFDKLDAEIDSYAELVDPMQAISKSLDRFDAHAIQQFGDWYQLKYLSGINESDIDKIVKPLNPRLVAQLVRDVAKRKWQEQRLSDYREKQSQPQQHQRVARELESNAVIEEEYPVTDINPCDYFPNGATGSITRKTGPSAAKSGDNPLAKTMALSEAQELRIKLHEAYLKFLSK